MLAQTKNHFFVPTKSTAISSGLQTAQHAWRVASWWRRHCRAGKGGNKNRFLQQQGVNHVQLLPGLPRFFSSGREQELSLSFTPLSLCLAIFPMRSTFPSHNLSFSSITFLHHLISCDVLQPSSSFVFHFFSVLLLFF
jgi:hypothetical protein